MAGLSSLTETYTDSEDEGQGDTGMRGGPRKQSSRDGQQEAISSGSNPSTTPKIKQLLPLVSYIDDDNPLKVEPQLVESQEIDHSSKFASLANQFSGAENNDNIAHSDIDNLTSLACTAEASDCESLNSDFILMELLSATRNRLARPHPDTCLENPKDSENVIQSQNLVISGGMQLPPEPPGLCSPSLQESINRLWERKKVDKSFDLNLIIQNKKAFRNPSIYEKLIEYCGIDEYGTNFPKELYDGHLFGKESYYEELAKEMDSMERARAQAAKIMKTSNDPSHIEMVKMVLKK